MSSIMYARQCSLMIHNPTTSSSSGGDEVILNPEVFPDMRPGNLIQIFDPENPSNIIVLKVPNKAQLPTGRMEISLMKTIAEAAGFKQFSRVVVGHISESEAKIDFVELSFRRQYLQRGNMLRFKTALIGRTIFQNQNVTINSMQANIQDLRKSSKPIVSGLVTNSTKFVFRSKSARIVWLVQISAEMWDVDKDGEMYFEKFLKDFVSPVFDSWKSLGVTHMLTIIFFARTLYLDERLSPSTHPELFSKKSFMSSDGYYQQDHIKIVLENIADIDKHAHISKLRSELWTFAQDCGWKIPDPQNTAATGMRAMASWPSTQSLDASETSNKLDETRGRSSTDSNALNHVSCAVPTDSMHGNFLEAINISLNILDKHYMDRDLNRTGNSIVMISAGTGIFKVKPRLALITKQRMLDNAFGIDCVSLARPPVHTVPLFVVNGKKHQSKDFYEVPHWIRISFTDCQKDFENAKFLQGFGASEINEMLGSDWDSAWAKQVSPHPVAQYLSSQLGYYGFLVAQLKTDSSIKVAEALATLRQNYAQLLPYPLRNFLLLQQQGNGSSSDDGNAPILTPKASFVSSSLISQQLLPQFAEETVTPWGLLSIESSQIDIFRKTIILQQDVHSLRRLHAKSSITHGKIVPDIFDTIPNLKGVKEQHQASSYNSNDDGIISRGLTSMAQSLEDDNSYLQNSWHGSEGASLLKNKMNNNANTGGSVGASVGRHRAPSVHDNSSVGGHSAHSGTGAGSTTGGGGAGNEAQSRYESVLVRKTQLQELSRFDEIDTDVLLEIFNAYDTMASNCFKRNTPQTVNLHDTLSGNSLTAMINADDKSNNATGRMGVRDRANSSLIEVDEDKNSSSGVGTKRLSHTSPMNKSKKHPSSTSAPPSTANNNASVASASNLQLSKNGVPKKTGHLAIATGSNSPGIASNEKSLPVPPHHGNAPMLGGSAAVAYAARLKPRPFAPPTAASRPTLPLPPTASTSATASATSLVTHTPPNTATTATTSSNAASADAISTSSSSSSSEVKAPAASKPMPKDPAAARLLQASMNKSKLAGHNRMAAVAAAAVAAGHGKTLTRAAPGMSLTMPPNGMGNMSPAVPLTHPSQSSTTSTPALPSTKNGANNSNTGTNNAAAAANAAGASLLQHQTSSHMARRVDNSPVPQMNNAHPAGGKMIMRGGLMRMMAEHSPYHHPHGPAPTFIAKSDKQDKEAEDFFDYQEKYAINPFRLKDGMHISNLSLITHNRRRWSHVFPMGRAAKTVDYSLNWKSLTQPAILPLNTDYLPKKEELSVNYTCEDACYDFDPQSCPFSSLSSAMLELICQRLSHEYQVIDNFDRSKYLNMSKYTVTSQKDSTAFILTMGHRIHVVVGDPISKKLWVTRYISKSGRNEEEKKEAESDRTRMQYRYEMWSTQSGKFQTLSQTFQLFPDEFLWSHIDSLILNETQYDGNTKGKKPRNLAYVIIPPSCMKTEAEVDEYFGRIDQLLEFLNKNVGEEPMSVNKERSLFPTSEIDADLHNYNASLWHRQASREMAVMRRYLRGPKHENPNWVYIKYDKNIYTFKAFHFHLEWFVCDSWEVNDFVNTIYRRSSKLGLRMCQTPGYFSSHDLNIHPFRPIPYVQVPSLSVPINPVHSSPMRVVERLFFAQDKGEWIFDSERNTDWIGLGLPFPNYAERDRDIVQGEAELNQVKASHVSQLQQLAQSASSLENATSSTSAVPALVNGTAAANKSTGISDLFTRFFRSRKDEDGQHHPSQHGHVESVSSAGNTPSTLSQTVVTGDSTSSHHNVMLPISTTAVGTVMLPASTGMSGTSYPRLMSKRFDRQYIHCHGLATVRVGGQGFLWLPSASAKVSDLNTPLDEKNAQARQKLEYLESTAAVIVECYEFVVVNLMDHVFNAIDCREIIRDVVTSALDDNCPYRHHTTITTSIASPTSSMSASTHTHHRYPALIVETTSAVSTSESTISSPFVNVNVHHISPI